MPGRGDRVPKVDQQHLDARRRQIIDAAIVCFARDGFHRATMRDVCREAGLSLGAVYRYFAGKDEIIEAIADERHAREAGFIEHAEEAAEGVEALRALGRDFFSSLADPDERRRRVLGVQVWAEALRNPAVHRLVMRGTGRQLEEVAKLVREAQERGELAPQLDPEGVARVMTALFQGFVLQQAWDERADVATYLETVEAMVDALLPARVP
jgi:AcrR family transcriptional regulator